MHAQSLERKPSAASESPTCALSNSALPSPFLSPSLPQQGVTTYFSGDCTMEDAKLAQDFLDSQVWELAIWDTSLMGLLVPTPLPLPPCFWVPV